MGDDQTNNDTAVSASEENLNTAIELDTSNLIIGITNVFNSAMSYEDTMMAVLQMISDILRPDRLLIFERGEETTSCTFEWHAENIPSNIELMQDLSNEQFDMVGKLARGEDVLDSNLEDMKEVDERLAQRFDRQGVSRMMAVPLFSNGRLIGSLSANNYRLAEGVDAKRVLDAVAPFVSSRILAHRLMMQLERMGTHDSLTGLLNRRGIEASTEEHLSADPSAPYALAIVDVDDFKIVNDQYGHDVGDAALKSLAQSIEQTFPSSALIGRNGGDEFLVMLFGDDTPLMGPLLEALAQSDLSCELNGERYALSLSIGYAEFPTLGNDLKDMYSKADEALYAVKLAGKSGCKRYSPSQESQYRSQFGFTPRNITENAPCAIAITTAKGAGEILYANSTLISMADCSDFTDFMDFTDGAFENLMHPDDRDAVHEEFIRQLRAGKLGNKTYLDYRIVTKTGAVKYIADSSRVVSFKDVGKVSYVLMVDKGERASVQQ